MHYYGTLGPACRDVDTLTRLFQAGMTGVRLNLSHGDLEQNSAWLGMVKEAAGRCGVKPELLIDLQGPELRIGRLEREFLTEVGDRLLFGDGGIPAPSLFLEQAEPGDRFLLDDGKLEFVVERTVRTSARSAAPLEGNEPYAEAFEEEAGNQYVLHARTLRGGILKSGKSLAPEGKELSAPTLTESDRRNIRLAKRYGVTGVMLPFVRGKEDLLTLRNELRAAGVGDMTVFAKIENMRGVNKFAEILGFCDQVVIARGDLGNAMPLWKLPGIQKKLAATCCAADVPFLIVTQMLDSMQERPTPTRAEVLDIFNAVQDGASALMLTGETAVGKFPVEAMEYLVKTGNEALTFLQAFH